MNRLSLFPQNFAAHVFLFAGMALSLYFSYHTVYGERSIAHLRILEAELVQQKAALLEIESRRSALERDVVMMRPETLSLDLLEERARQVLGYKKPSEYIIFGN